MNDFEKHFNAYCEEIGATTPEEKAIIENGFKAYDIDSLSKEEIYYIAVRQADFRIFCRNQELMLAQLN